MFQILAPPRDLQPYVRFFWSVKAPAGSTPVERVIPDGCCELIWQFAAPFRRLNAPALDDHQPQAFVFGQIRNAICLQPLGDADVLGVRFAPAGLSGLWGIDVSTIGPRECSLDELFPARHRLSIDELRDAASARGFFNAEERNAAKREFIERCTFVSRWLRLRLRRTERPQARRAGAALSLMEAGTTNIAQIAREIGATRRGVERAFRVAVGLSPAAYLRLRKVEYCSRALRCSGRGLAAIAADAGYADHAHFSREFRTIAGMSPGAYRRELGAHAPMLP